MRAASSRRMPNIWSFWSWLTVRADFCLELLQWSNFSCKNADNLSVCKQRSEDEHQTHWVRPIDNEEMVNLEKALAHSLALCRSWTPHYPEAGVDSKFEFRMFIQQIGSVDRSAHHNLTNFVLRTSYYEHPKWTADRTDCEHTNSIGVTLRALQTAGSTAIRET